MRHTFVLAATIVLPGCAVPQACKVLGPKYDTVAAMPLPPPQQSSIGELGCGVDLNWKEYALELGLRYEEGRGVPRDDSLAARYYEIAAVSRGATRGSLLPVRVGGQGDVIAVPGDEADPGEPEAMLRLGRMYLEGRGVPASRGRALDYLRAAVRHGSSAAREDLNRLGEPLEPLELARPPGARR